MRYFSYFVEDVHHRAVETRPGAANGFVTWASAIWSIEAVVNVSRHAVGISNRVCPIKRAVVSPIAHGVENRSPCLVESLAHDVISVERDLSSATLALVETDRC